MSRMTRRINEISTVLDARGVEHSVGGPGCHVSAGDEVVMIRPVLDTPGLVELADQHGATITVGQLDDVIYIYLGA